jgi:hypothetical protein
MDDRHQQERPLYMDRRHERVRGRQILRDAVSRRLQTFFITLRAAFPEDADALLQRIEAQATPREHRSN